MTQPYSPPSKLFEKLPEKTMFKNSYRNAVFAIADLMNNHRAGLSPSHRTVHVPSPGNPGACLSGAPSQPAAIMATA